MRRFEQMARALVGMGLTEHPDYSKWNATQLEKKVSLGASEMIGGAMTRNVSEMINAFIGDGIATRVLPCGTDSSSNHSQAPSSGEAAIYRRNVSTSSVHTVRN